jgi:hypothetical protein
MLKNQINSKLKLLDNFLRYYLYYFLIIKFFKNKTQINTTIPRDFI